ncbi:MAG: MFS transporter [Patescibacteria group bacterium]
MFKFNNIIKLLTISDLAYQFGAGFITPVFAIFLINSIENSATIVGTAAAIYWVTKSIIRLPIGYFLDKKRGERDDFYSLVAGFFVMSICYFLFLFAKTPTHIYLVQILMGIGGAFAFTPWYGFFSRHIDKNQENFEWGVSISLTGFVMAGAGFVAGIVADKFGFAPLFVAAGIFSLLGTALLLFIGKHIKLKKNDGFTLIK